MYDGIDKNKWYEFGIPVYEIENINEELELLQSLSLDIIIMCGWRQIIESHILEIPKYGVVGFHPTLLPEGRGPAPIINTILEGKKKSGVTIFFINEKTDGGDIIGQKKFDIKENDYAGDLYKKVTFAGKYLIKKYLPLLMRGEAPKIPQEEKDAIYFKKRTIKDNEIKLGIDGPEEVLRKVRAFSKPYLGAYIRINGKKLIIWKTELNEKND